MSDIQIKPVDIDVEENALDSLEMAAEFLDCSNMKHQWKWVSIALFNALYGFCIAAIRGTNPDRVLKPVKCKKCKSQFGPFEILGQHKCPSCGQNLQIRYKDIKLIDFKEAFRQVQQNNLMRQFVQSKTMVFTDSQKESVTKLHEFYRNDFEHFIPVLGSYPDKNPKIVSDVVDIIEKLVIESGNIAYHLINGRSQRFIKAIQNIRKNMGSATVNKS